MIQNQPGPQEAATAQSYNLCCFSENTSECIKVVQNKYFRDQNAKLTFNLEIYNC